MPAILLTSRVLLLLLLTRLLRLQHDTLILLLLWIPLLTRWLQILLRWLEYLLSCWTPLFRCRGCSSSHVICCRRHRSFVKLTAMTTIGRHFSFQRCRFLPLSDLTVILVTASDFGFAQS